MKTKRTQTQRTRRRPAAKRRGFSLIEIMMVVVIIGILGALLVPNLIGRGDQARVTAAKHDLRSIAAALDLYRLDNSAYPSTSQGLAALVAKPAGFPAPKRWGPDPYLKKAPVDPWENEFVYANEGRSFALKSLGADGLEGGDDINADIRYADL